MKLKYKFIWVQESFQIMYMRHLQKVDEKGVLQKKILVYQFKIIFCTKIDLPFNSVFYKFWKYFSIIKTSPCLVPTGWGSLEPKDSNRNPHYVNTE